MRIENSYRIIPCYTADVSGVCSALFELGGMVVMHDPSGCNSTYNTHDETRWYKHDSLIYITALTEQDAVMGNDRKAVCDIIDAAHRLSPRFIALCGSPIPYLNGTDYKALARIIERETGISSFAVDTNGMHDYVQGAGTALLEYAKHVLKPQWDAALCHNSTSPKSPITINILGATPLDFAADGTLDSLKSVLTDRGFDVLSVFSMLGDSNIDSLSYAVLADVNLVISSVGYRLAQYMLKEYGIPFVAGLPVGDFTDRLCADIEHAVRLRKLGLFPESTSIADITNRSVSAFTDLDSEAMPAASELAIIGEPVTSGSIAAAITARYGIAVSVLCPLEGCEPFLTQIDHRFKGEKQCTRLMQQYKHIIADPLYLPICPDGVRFHRLPHAAFSGRCCRSEMKNLVTLLDSDIKEANYGIK